MIAGVERGELDALMRALVESTPDAILIVDDDDRIALANEGAEEIFGFNSGELDGMNVGMLVPEASRARHDRLIAGFRREPRERAMGAGMDLRAVRKDGREFDADISLRPLQAGSRSVVAAIVRDVTELRRGQAASGWLTAVVQSCGEAIVGLARDGTIASWNPAAEQLYGYASAEVLGRSEEILAPPDCRLEQQRLRARALTGDPTTQFETEHVRNDATRFPVSVTTSPIRNVRGAVIGVVVIARDITDRRMIEHELKFLADHDLLTGLFNRRRLTEELKREMAHALRYPSDSGALLIGDLDDFKQINDTIGHRAGDELIRALANVLRARLRDTDVLARLGGDEFAVLLPHIDLERAVPLAEELCAAVRDFEMVVDGRRVRTTASIGIAPIDPELSLTDVLAAADSAMYEAKRLGRDRVAATQPQPGEERRLGWSERLRAALDENRFELYAQPIVAIARPAGQRCELLLRLREGTDLVPPAAFIYAAERFHVIEEIDRHVIARAVGLINTDPAPDTRYHINLSGVSIAEPETLSYLRDQISAAAINPARLTVEITETAAITDLDVAQRFARELRQVGCSLALDDFGSGFGSFSYLKRIPVQFIKIDDSFITGLAHSGNDRVVVKGIIDVAHGLDAGVIAEHVRDEETRAILEQYEVDYGQGYHFGRPMPLAARAMSPAA